jgi:hypothetical protein
MAVHIALKADLATIGTGLNAVQQYSNRLSGNHIFDMLIKWW